MQLLATLWPLQLTFQYVLLATKHSLNGEHHIIVQPFFQTLVPYTNSNGALEVDALTNELIANSM